MKQIIDRNKHNEYLSTYNVITYNITKDTSTRVKYKKKEGNKKALIWIHGFNDYYYHFHIGDKLLNEGYDIYAITLRRYGEVCFNTKDLFYTNDLHR